MPVTVPGSPATGSPNVTLSMGTGDVLQLAQQISNLLFTEQGAGSLSVSSVSGSSTTLPAAPTVPGTTTELLIQSSSPINAVIPAGYNYVLPIGPGGSTLTGSNVDIVPGTIGGTFYVSGASTVAPLGGNNTVAASGNYVLSFGAGNNVVMADGAGTIATDSGTSTVVASNLTGSDNMIESNGTGDFIAATYGSNTVVATGSGVRILGGVGTLVTNVSGNGAIVSTGQTNAAIVISGSNAAVFGGNGTLLVDDTGSGTAIVAATGATSVVAAGSNELIVGGSGTLNATVSGGNDTIGTGIAPSTITASSNALVFGGAGAITFVGGAGTATIVGGSGGSEQVTGGAGGVVFSAGQSNDGTLINGSGTSTIFGGSGSVTNFHSNLGGGILVAFGGNETLNAAASTVADTLSGGNIPGSQADVIGGSGSDVLFAGAGSDTLTGSGGSDTFAFFASATNGGQDAITDFNASDSLFLLGYDSTKSAVGTNASGHVTLTLSDSTTITFTNLTDTTALNGHYLFGNQ